MRTTVVTLFAITVAVYAKVYTFNNSINPPYIWSNPNIWNPNGVPGADDTAIINNAKNVEMPYGNDVKVQNITLNAAELKMICTSGSGIVTIGSITLTAGSKIFVDAVAPANSTFIITSGLNVANSTFTLRNQQNGGDFSGATLTASGTSVIEFASNGFVKGFKTINFAASALFTCTESPQGLNWNGPLSGSLSHCAIYNSVVTAVGNLQFSSVVLNKTTVTADKFQVTIQPPMVSEQNMHLTDGSSLTAGEIIFWYPYNLTTPSPDTNIACDFDCSASITTQNVTLDGFVNNGYNIKFAVCVKITGTLRVSNALYANMSELLPAPYVHFAQGADVANVQPLPDADGRRFKILVGGVYQTLKYMCQTAGKFTMVGKNGNLNLWLQEDAVLDNVNINGTLFISNTVTKTPANVLIKNGGGCRTLNIQHGTLTFDQSTKAYSINDQLLIEHPADYQLKQSVLSVSTITGNQQVVLFPTGGFYINSPLPTGLNRTIQSLMNILIDVPMQSPGGEPVQAYVSNSQMKVSLTFSMPAAPPAQFRLQINPQKNKMQNSTVDLTINAPSESYIDASQLKLTSDGYTAQSTFSVSVGNNSMLLPADWNMPKLTVNGKLAINGNKALVGKVGDIVMNAAGGTMPELTTTEGLETVGDFSVTSASGEWLAKGIANLNGNIQGGGTLKVTGQKPNATIDVYLSGSAIQNLILSRVSLSHNGNPTSVSGVFQVVESTYINMSTNATTNFHLNSGATWEFTKVNHTADLTISISADQSLCLDEQVGQTTKSCVGNKAIVPSAITTAKFSCVSTASPPPPKSNSSEVAGIVIGVLIVVGIAIGAGVFYMKRRGRHGYKDVDDSKL